MCLNVICMNTFYFFEKNIYFHALIISAYCFKYLPIYKKKSIIGAIGAVPTGTFSAYRTLHILQFQAMLLLFTSHA